MTARPATRGRIERDRWGIPHVEADDLDGLFHGQGYACAQDRLWQIEWDRRRALGRTAEIAGAAAVPIDAFARKLRIVDAATRGYAALDDESRAMLVSYTRGVNDAIIDGARALELERIGAPAPEPWEPWHSVACFLVRHVAFGGTWVTKLFRARVLRHYGVTAALAFVREGVPGDVVPTITGGSAAIPAPPSDVSVASDALALVEDALLDPPVATNQGDGSNSWALTGERTRSGMPILAGDPHRALEAPNVYLQVYLRAPGIDVAGLAFAGVPGVPHFGHAGAAAWCVTNAAADTDDVYVERVADVTDRRVETIRVSGAADVEVECAVTRHGPVLATAGGYAIALRSAGLASPGAGFASIVPLLRARTRDDIEAALEHWVDPVNNWLAADAGGVRYMTRGHVPRKSELSRWLPVPGWTDDFEWDGIRDDLPSFDGDGEVVTANNRICADTTISPDYAPPGRASRIRLRLADVKDAVPADMAAIHADDVTVAGANDEWDGRMSADSREAARYAQTRSRLGELMLEALPALAGTGPAEPPGASPGAARLVASRRALFAAGVVDPQLQERAATDGHATWGELHRTRYTHGLRVLAPEVAAACTAEGVPMSGDGECVLCTASVPGLTYDAMHASCARYAFEIGERPSGMWVVPLGASGDPASPHFADQQAIWQRVEMVPIEP